MREKTKRQGTGSARKLRRIPTDGEVRFWSRVRDRQINGAKFRRQWPIGPYVADFVCLELRLIVEIDGGQHAKNTRDEVRTHQLEALGFTVVRFWNNDVLNNIDGVLTELSNTLHRRSLSPVGRGPG